MAAEMMEPYAYEIALVQQRSLECCVVCTFMLVVHCCVIAFQFWPPDSVGDSVLGAFCVARVACGVLRPRYWLRTWRVIVEARALPTAQLVSERLQSVWAPRYSFEKLTEWFYYMWLACLTFSFFCVNIEMHSPFARQLWLHCQINYAYILFHRVVFSLHLLYLVCTDHKRGMSADVLEKYSKCITFLKGSDSLRDLVGDSECSICFGAYDDGDEVRKLACRHHFHRQCVDEWLLGHQNCCPMCNNPVGPVSIR